MIRSDEEPEAALEAVSRWLEHPPKHGSADEQRFHILLRDIASAPGGSSPALA